MQINKVQSEWETEYMRTDLRWARAQQRDKELEKQTEYKQTTRVFRLRYTMCLIDMATWNENHTQVTRYSLLLHVKCRWNSRRWFNIGTRSNFFLCCWWVRAVFIPFRFSFHSCPSWVCVHYGFVIEQLKQSVYLLQSIQSNSTYARRWKIINKTFVQHRTSQQYIQQLTFCNRVLRASI